MRGQWIVVIRDIPSNEDTSIGPFHAAEKADEVAQRFNRDFAATGASHVMEAVAKWVRPGIEVTDLRDELLAELEEAGYGFVPSEKRNAIGFNADVGF